jgi:predicted choloylglycine hydrolase
MLKILPLRRSTSDSMIINFLKIIRFILNLLYGKKAEESGLLFFCFHEAVTDTADGLNTIGTDLTQLLSQGPDMNVQGSGFSVIFIPPDLI